MNATVLDRPAQSAPGLEQFRRCAVTGLAVYGPAERLIKANAVAATVALLIGGISAILILLTRWQAVHLLTPVMFYRVLTAHGISMLIFFIIFFEMAVLYFAAGPLLNSRIAAPKFGWFNFGLMTTGAVLVEAMIWSGKADVLMTSYIPLRAHPLYYLGIILFAVGALLVCAQFFATLVIAKREKTYQGSLPLITFGAVTAAIIAVITLLHGAATYIPAFLWSIGLLDMNPQVYRMLWWALGHSSQQINVAAMVSIWYLLGALTVGAVVLNEKISRTAFVLYILFISMASAHHLLVDPGFSSSWKVVNTSYFMYMAVLASLLHGFTVPAGVEVGQRLRGATKGLFGWVKRAPWGDPGFSSLVLSVVVFGFVGGITGVTIGTEQINMVVHNTLRVPGHFHATVVSGTAMAFMGLTYYLIPLIFRKKVAFWRLAQVQPYLFAGGMLIFSIFMSFAGGFGVPRRHWDINFPGAPFQMAFHPAVDALMAIMALGGLLAATGGGLYILITVWSVFFGKPFTEADRVPGARGLAQGIIKPPRAITRADKQNLPAGKWGYAPGTMALVVIFLVAFAVYYFANWKLLSLVWKIG